MIAIYLTSDMKNFNGKKLILPASRIIELERNDSYSEKMSKVFQQIKEDVVDYVFLDICYLTSLKNPQGQNIEIGRHCLNLLKKAYSTGNSALGTFVKSTKTSSGLMTIVFNDSLNYKRTINLSLYNSNEM